MLEDNIIYIDNLKRKNYIRIDTTEMGYEIIDMASPDDVEQMLKSNCYGVYASEVNMSLVYEFNTVMFNKVFSYLIENKRLFLCKRLKKSALYAGVAKRIRRQSAKLLMN